MHTIAILGGTFDPVHNGHIQTSLVIQKHFHFDSYRFLPCKVPALKPPTLATTVQRLAMLQIAIKPYDFFEIDLREIIRSSPSYTVDTLKSLRDEHKTAAIILIIGHDALLSLPQWYHWEEIITLANLLVINRSHFKNQPLTEPILSFVRKHKVEDKESFLKQTAGALYEFDAGDYPISSTAIRAELKQQQSVTTQLPQEVYNYIRQMGLYQ